MSTRYPSAELPPLVLLAQRALRQAVANVVEEHRRSGHPLVVWQDGHVTYLDPATLPQPPASPAAVHEGG